jgi:hypothetical protein
VVLRLHEGRAAQPGAAILDARTARFRRLARVYERLAGSLAALHYVAFAMLMLGQLGRSLAGS